MSPIVERKVPGFWASYLWSVTAAAICLTVIAAIAKSLQNDAGLDDLSKISPAIGNLVRSAPITWVEVCLVGLAPYALSVAIASRFDIRSGWYFAVSGIVTGLLLDGLLTALGNLMLYLDGYRRSPEIFSEMVWLLTGGALGGSMTYWWRRGRFGSPKPSRPSSPP